MEEALIKRVMPHSIEAEQSVVGAMLMDKDAILTAAEIVSGQDFYQTAYGVIFDSMVELFNEGKPVDLVTLQERLKEKDVPPEIASLEFVRDLVSAVPTSANVKYYAQIVADKSMLRKLIKLNDEISNTCYAGKESLETILETTEKSMFQLLQQRNTGEYVPIRQVVLNALDKIEKASKSKGTVTGIPTGFIDLDYKVSGLQPSDLILVAARPSMGKTAFVLNIAQYVAFKKDRATAIFSLEMSKEQLVFRLLGCIADIEPSKILKGTLSAPEMKRIQRASDELERLPIWIDERTDLSVADLRYQISLRRKQGRCEMVIVDYLQLMLSPSEDRKSTNDQISAITRQLKLIAKENDIPVVLLSQLNRNCEARPTLKNMLSDLRDSGSIEQDADTVFFLRRLSVMNIDEDPETRLSTEGRGTLSIAKNRHGESGEVRFCHNKGVTRFTDDRTPVPNDRRPAKAELDKDLFG